MMTTADQIDVFRRDINAVINRYAEEFNLPYAAAIGVLVGLAIELQQEAREVGTDDHSSFS